MENKIKSVYIHIPFCSSICSYCDFCKMFYNEKFVKKYLSSLEKEIKANYCGEYIETLYIGGGSPSCLSLEELSFLFEIISIFKLRDNYEFTVEVNVSDITEEKMSLFKKVGVNRLSIGVETINDKFLSFLNRDHTRSQVYEKIGIAKKYFSNINIDLMYAFPNETMEDLYNDLKFIYDVNPVHVSIYSLIIEPHTKIYIDGVKSIDEELDSSMYYNIIKSLREHGYNHYEISNFSKKGFESRHNLCYWNNDEYYGFGLGASGYVNSYRYTNTRNLNSYFEGNYKYINEFITNDVKMENELIFGLRKTSGVSINTFREKYLLDIEQIFDIIDLVNNNMLKIEEGYIFIPEDKLYISNSILVNFIGGSNGNK